MTYTDQVIEKAASFWDENKEALIGGGAGALLSGLAGYNMAGTNPWDTPSQKLKKRLKTALAAGIMGGSAGGVAGHLLKETDAVNNLKKLTEPDKEWHLGWEGTAGNTAKGGIFGALIGGGTGAALGPKLQETDLDRRIKRKGDLENAFNAAYAQRHGSKEKQELAKKLLKDMKKNNKSINELLHITAGSDLSRRMRGGKQGILWGLPILAGLFGGGDVVGNIINQASD